MGSYPTRRPEPSGSGPSVRKRSRHHGGTIAAPPDRLRRHKRGKRAPKVVAPQSSARCTPDATSSKTRSRVEGPLCLSRQAATAVRINAQYNRANTFEERLEPLEFENTGGLDRAGRAGGGGAAGARGARGPGGAE